MLFPITSDGFWRIAPDFLKPLVEMTPAMGLETNFFPMGDPDLDETPGCVMLRMFPGYVLERHSHTCERFETIVSGTLYVGDDVLGPGDVMTATAGEFYGPHTAGPEGCVTVEVFSSFKASYQPMFELPDGSAKSFNYMAGEVPPAEVMAAARLNAPGVPA